MRTPPRNTANPPRAATTPTANARIRRPGTGPKISTKAVKNRSTPRAPEYPTTTRRAAANVARTAACSFSFTGLPSEGLPEGLEVRGVRVEVRPDGIQLVVQALRDARLEVLGVELPAGVGPRELPEGREHDVPAVLRVPLHAELPAPREEDHPRDVEDGVPLRLLRGAVRLGALPPPLGGRVVDQHARVGLRLRHLRGDGVHPAPALEPREEGRMEGDDLLPPELRGHVPVEHVGVPLVHPPVREVEVHPRDVGDLHRGVDEFRGVEVRLLLLPPHDRQGPFDPGDARGLRDLEDLLPVRRPGDELVRVQELDLVGHAEGAEAVLEVLPARLDRLEVAPELVVDVRVPVREEEDRVEPRADEVRDLRGDDESRADVHEPGRLEPGVRPRTTALREEGPQLVPRDALLRAAQDEVQAVVYGHGTRNREGSDKGFSPASRGPSPFGPPSPSPPRPSRRRASRPSWPSPRPASSPSRPPRPRA